MLIDLYKCIGIYNVLSPLNLWAWLQTIQTLCGRLASTLFMFIFCITWLGVGPSWENLAEQYAHWCQYQNICQILLQLLSSAEWNNSNVKILPDLTKMSKLTENLYPIFCSQISIKHFCTKFIILLSLAEEYNFTLSNAKSLCFTICLMTDNFIC